MSEFAALREMGKVIGVLTDTGGLADELENLTEKFNKASKGKVIFHNSPTELVALVIEELSLISKKKL